MTIRFDFFRRSRRTFLRPRRGFWEIMAAAGQEAGAAGVDSLDLLVATLDIPRVARLVTGLGASPQAIQVAARQARTDRDPRPGLTDDAKAVVEAASHRALIARSDPDVQDLLVGLSVADCQARQVLRAQGIEAERLIGRVGSPHLDSPGS
jgi:hypothetical protein